MAKDLEWKKSRHSPCPPSIAKLMAEPPLCLAVKVPTLCGRPNRFYDGLSSDGVAVRPVTPRGIPVCGAIVLIY
jgi:hypothetical protein